MKASEYLQGCKVEVKLIPYMGISTGEISFSQIQSRAILILLGTKEVDEYGFHWTFNDMPIILAHEVAHIVLMSNSDKPILFRSFCDMSLSEQLDQIKEEIDAWKLVFRDNPEDMELIARAQALLNTYIFAYYHKKERY